MALYADRVKESTTATGTGAITLSGSAPTGYQTFATAFGASPQTVAYCIADQTGNNWEVGTGVFNGTTGLTRVTVLGSSNSGSLVNFTGGTQDVFCTAPAKYLNTFTSTTQGTVPASGGGTSNFLRADGSFAAPPTTAPAGSNTQIQYNNAGAFGASSNLTYNNTTTTLTVPNLSANNRVTTAQVRGFSGNNLQIQANQYVSVKCETGSPYLEVTADGAYFRSPAGSSMGVSAYADSDPEIFSAYAVTKATTTFNTFSVLDISGVFGTINLAPSRSVSTINRIYSKVESYNEIQIGSGSLTSVSVATEYDSDAGVEVQPLLSFYGAGVIAKPAPTASGTGNVLSSVVTALNNLGLVNSAGLTNATTLTAAGSNTQIQFNSSNAFGASSNFTYDAAGYTLTVGPAGQTTNIETLAPTGSTIAGTLRFRGKNASATNGNGGGFTFLGGSGLGTGVGGGLGVTCGSGRTGGGFSVLGGDGTATGGSFSLSGGNGNTVSGGAFILSGGIGGTGTASGGGFELYGGNASASGAAGGFILNAGSSVSGAGGDFTLLPGGGATSGNMYLSDSIGNNVIWITDNLTSPQLGFFNATPVVQPTTATASATRIAVIGTVANVGDTYDGYTLAKVVKALRNLGILA